MATTLLRRLEDGGHEATPRPRRRQRSSDATTWRWPRRPSPTAARPRRRRRRRRHDPAHRVAGLGGRGARARRERRPARLPHRGRAPRRGRRPRQGAGGRLRRRGAHARPSISVEADGRLAGVPTDALNEAVLEKTPMGHTVRLGVHLDGEFFTTYAADGLIVATPTGSTAYSFSARGPILDPDLRALVLTPVSPHMLFDRSMVIAPDVEVRLEVLGHRPATLSVDGREHRRAARGRHRRVHGVGHGGAAGDLRAARLPPHPQDEVRTRRPIGAERVVDVETSAGPATRSGTVRRRPRAEAVLDVCVAEHRRRRWTRPGRAATPSTTATTGWLGAPLSRGTSRPFSTMG